MIFFIIYCVCWLKKITTGCVVISGKRIDAIYDDMWRCECWFACNEIYCKCKAFKANNHYLQMISKWSFSTFSVAIINYFLFVFKPHNNISLEFVPKMMSHESALAHRLVRIKSFDFVGGNLIQKWSSKETEVKKCRLKCRSKEKRWRQREAFSVWRLIKKFLVSLVSDLTRLNFNNRMWSSSNVFFAFVRSICAQRKSQFEKINNYFFWSNGRNMSDRLQWKIFVVIYFA